MRGGVGWGAAAGSASGSGILIMREGRALVGVVAPSSSEQSRSTRRRCA